MRTPKGVRPTQDRVRKGLFDVLGGDVPGRRVADLFAGSGALGIEALSRGAASALFVEEGAGAVRTILANLTDLGLMGDTGRVAEVWRADYRQALRRARREGRTFDLILMDPPYREGLLPEALVALAGAEVLSREGLVVAEAEARLSAPEVDRLRLIDERVYGGTQLMFWEVLP